MHGGWEQRAKRSEPRLRPASMHLPFSSGLLYLSKGCHAVLRVLACKNLAKFATTICVGAAPGVYGRETPARKRHRIMYLNSN